MRDTTVWRGGRGGARAAGEATLNELTGSELPKAFQPGKRYTLRLEYKNPTGDPVKKGDAQFIDEAPSGKIATSASAGISGDTSKGATLEWDINGFEQGAHKGHFEVKTLAGVTRYPAEQGDFYNFVVEALATKFIILGIGAAVGFLAVPFLTYFAFRMMNPRGDPSRVARVGLLFGVLAFCALFIYLFASVFGPLVYAILVLGFIAALILLLGKR